MHKRARRGLLVAGLVLAGSLSIASAAHAGGCTSMPGHGTVCGTVHNDTGRGFHTTLQWGEALGRALAGALGRALVVAGRRRCRR